MKNAETALKVAEALSLFDDVHHLNTTYSTSFMHSSQPVNKDTRLTQNDASMLRSIHIQSVTGNVEVWLSTPLWLGLDGVFTDVFEKQLNFLATLLMIRPLFV